MRVVVVGAGMAGLSAARAIAEAGHSVQVLDKGRRVGGRLATKQLGGGANADYGAQFFTARSKEFRAAVATWLAEGTVREWCRGFGGGDGHPRFVARNGMAELAGRLAVGLELQSSVTVGAVRQGAGGWIVNWSATRRGEVGSMEADVVVLTAPVPQSAGLVGDRVPIPEVRYTPTLSLLAVLAGPPSIPSPGAIQFDNDPLWSWIADNAMKGVSAIPAVTLHTRAEVASARWHEDDQTLTAELLSAAAPWLGGAPVVEVALHRWWYATPVDPYPERCWVSPEGGIVLAGDAFGGPKVEGAFLSGLAAAAAISLD